MGGNFTTIGGVGHNYFVRLNADGTIDPTFNVTVNDFVESIAIQRDGNVIVAGDFTTVNGASHRYLVRVLNNLATESLTVPDLARVQWLRGGSSPETQDVTFEVSTNNGASWNLLGNAVRINGGWLATGLSLPVHGHVRARARVSGESSGLVETVSAFSFPLESWRLKYFGSPDNSGPGANLNDFDGDGIINIVEYGFGLNPTNSASRLPLPQIVGSNVTVEFNEPVGISGISYGAEWSLRLDGTNWTPISDVGTVPQHVFSVPAGTNETLFIRLKMTGP